MKASHISKPSPSNEMTDYGSGVFKQIDKQQREEIMKDTDKVVPVFSLLHDTW